MNDRAAKAIPGVRQVLVLDDVVAVVGDNTWAAKKGLAALEITWDEAGNGRVTSDAVWKQLRAAGNRTGATAKAIGDARKLLARGDRLDATYELPLLAHATMEPMNCTVHVKPDSCEVWVGSQVLGRAPRAAMRHCGPGGVRQFIATMAEVSVEDDGRVRVRRIVSAVDTGIAVNPDTIIAQIQGGLIFGVTAALWGRVTIERGRVQQSNFNNYRIMRMNEAPQIEVHVIQSGEAPGGIGEAGTTAAAPALCNAIFAATGVRVRGLPIDTALLAKRKSA